MRVSTSMIFEAGVSAINKQSAALLHIQQQVASGRRILRPSDDPVAAARALEVTQSQDVLAQYATNQRNATSVLEMTETQLASLTDMFGRLKELTVQAGGPALTPGDRKSIAFELRARYDQLLGIANAEDGQGQKLFAGYMGSTQPFGGTVDYLNAGNEIDYQGDDGQRRLQVSATRSMEVSDSGTGVFMRIKNGNGYFATNYAAANTGTGVINIGNVTDPAAWSALANNNLSINFTSSSSYDIVDGLGNTLVAGGAYLTGQPIVIPGAGASITIKGAPAAGDSFTVGPSTSQSVFKSLANLIGALEAGGTSPADMAKYSSELGFANANLDLAGDNILRVRAMTGSRLNELESLGYLNQDMSLQYQQTLSKLQDLDYAQAITDLTRKQTELEAAQQSFAKISQLSLFNYL